VSSPSNWTKTPVKFHRLNDLPKGKPNTAAEVMVAMQALHKMVAAQAKAYGGKDSKLLKVGIAENSLLQSVTQLDEIATAGVDENLETAFMCCNRLQRHLSEQQDEHGLELLLDVFKHINSALAATHGRS
jgi:hypothetical protein